MKRTLLLIKKEFIQLLRNKQMIVLIFLFPIIQLGVMGFAVSAEVKNVSLDYVDHDRTQASRELVKKFDVTQQFKIRKDDGSIQQAGSNLHRGEMDGFLYIPKGYNQKIMRGELPEIGLFLDGIDGNTSGLAAAYAQGIIHKKFSENSSNETEVNMLFNPDLNRSYYMVPGLVAVLLLMISLMLSSMSLVREKEMGTFEQLVVTPLKKQELLMGKLLPFLILAIISLFIDLKFAQLIFPIQMQGSYLFIGFASLLFLFSALAIGTLISTISATQQQAMFVSWFIMVFMILLSGLLINIRNMPSFIQYLTYLNPLRYYLEIIREVFQKGAGFKDLSKEIYILIIYGATTFSLAYAKFSKKAV